MYLDGVFQFVEPIVVYVEPCSKHHVIKMGHLLNGSKSFIEKLVKNYKSRVKKKKFFHMRILLVCQLLGTP